MLSKSLPVVGAGAALSSNFSSITFERKKTKQNKTWESALSMLQLPALIDVLFDTTARLKTQLEANRKKTTALLERANHLKVCF
jgi:cyanate permease